MSELLEEDPARDELAIPSSKRSAACPLISGVKSNIDLLIADCILMRHPSSRALGQDAFRMSFTAERFDWVQTCCATCRERGEDHTEDDMT